MTDDLPARVLAARAKYYRLRDRAADEMLLGRPVDVLALVKEADEALNEWQTLLRQQDAVGRVAGGDT